MATIDERPGPQGVRYRVRWRDEAGRHSQTFTDEGEAKAYVAQMEADRHRRTYRTPTSVTVREIIEDHIARSADRIEPSTLRGWGQYLRDHIPASLLKRRVVDVHTPEWQHWVDSLSRKGLAPGTVQPIVSMVMGALNSGVRMGTVERNTLKGVSLPTIRQAPMHVWSAADARKVLAHVHPDPRWHLVYLLALTTGMRPGELRALHWADYAEHSGVLYIHRTVAKQAAGLAVREGTKTGRGRHVKLAAVVREAIERWRAEGAGGPYLWGANPLPNMTWHRVQTRVAEAAGVERITLHGLRHSYATTQLELGTHPLVVSQVLGHSKINITLDRYSHVSVGLQAEASELLARALVHGVDHDNMGQLNEDN